MKLQKIMVGDTVRVDGDTKPWRVDARTKKGLLTLESLHSHVRIVWKGLHESRVQKSGAFR